MRFGEWDEPLLHSRPKPSPEVIAWAADRESPSRAAILESGDAPPEVLAYCAARAQWDKDWEAATVDRPWEVGVLSGSIRFFGGRWIHREEFMSYLGYDVASARFGDMQWAESFSTYGDIARAGRMDDCRSVAAVFYEYIALREIAQRLLVGALRDARLTMEAAK